MSDTVGTIIVAICGLIGTAVGSFGGMKLMTYRIEQLEKAFDKHNATVDDLVKRVYDLERKDAIQDERLGELEKRTDV